MDKKLKLGITLIALVIALPLSWYFSDSLKSGREDSALDRIVSDVKALDAQLPMAVDEYTRLDSIRTDRKSIMYHYTVWMDFEAFDTDLDTVISYMEKQTVMMVKENDDLALVREAGMTLIYYYRALDGSWSRDYSITPDMYK